MSLTSMLQKNVTGTVDKAYILFRRRQEVEDPKDVNDAFSFLAKMGEKMAASAAAQTGQEGNIAVYGENDYQPIKVQYNPSTLQLSSRGGKSFNRYSGVGGNGSGQFQIDDIPFEVTLNMDLIFDSMEIRDAFSYLDGSTGSITGAAKKATAIKDSVSGLFQNQNAAGNQEYNGLTVQDMSELFVSAITNAYTRMICVVWNKTVFWGELCGVTIEYSMFNSKGSPIRSKVHLEIRQDQRSNATVAAWKRTYKGLFTAANKLSTDKKLTSTSSMVSNYLNLS